jgi:hypothetical protein
MSDIIGDIASLAPTPSPKRAGLPEFWVTWIAKLLVGDQPCHFEAWVKGHYRIKKSLKDSAQLAQWRTQHTALLDEAVCIYRAEGWRCSVEKYVRLTGQTAVLTGKPDLVAQRANDRPRIIDVKGGEPKEVHVTQVLVYMVALPLAWRSPSMQFAGKVMYTTHEVDLKPSDADAIKPRLFALLKSLGSENRPAPAPSEQNCKFCDVSEVDCPQRWSEEQEPSVLVSEW